MRVQSIAALASIAIVLAAMLASAKPWWAAPGHWADYEYTLVGSAGGHEFRVTIRYHVEVVNATEKAFTVKTSVADVRIEAGSAEVRRMLEQQFGRLRGVSRLSTVPFETRPESLATVPFYASPSILPPGGHYSKIVQSAIGEIRIDAYYDTKTGWLKEAHVVYPSGHGAGGVGVREGVVKLVDSNFVGAQGMQRYMGGAVVWVAAAGLAAAAVGALLVVKKKR